MAKQYFPPANVLCAAMGTTPEALNKTGRVSVPTSLLRYLICAALSDFEIDSAHYKMVGYFEPRPLPIRFDGDYYTRRYRDVAKSIKEKKLANAAQHFNNTGVYELRSPRTDLEKIVGEWRKVLPVAPPFKRTST